MNMVSGWSQFTKDKFGTNRYLVLIRYWYNPGTHAPPVPTKLLIYRNNSNPGKNSVNSLVVIEQSFRGLGYISLASVVNEKSLQHVTTNIIIQR